MQPPGLQAPSTFGPCLQQAVSILHQPVSIAEQLVPNPIGSALAKQGECGPQSTLHPAHERSLGQIPCFAIPRHGCSSSYGGDATSRTFDDHHIEGPAPQTRVNSRPSRCGSQMRGAAHQETRPRNQADLHCRVRGQTNPWLVYSFASTFTIRRSRKGCTRFSHRRNTLHQQQSTLFLARAHRLRTTTRRSMRPQRSRPRVVGVNTDLSCLPAVHPAAPLRRSGEE